MRTPILVLALLLVSSSSFGQDANNQPLGGKTTESKPSTSKPPPTRKKPAPKPASNTGGSLSSPCGVNYKSRAEMNAESNMANKWFSLGQSANKHFWYNPHRTTCDAKTGVLKSWMKEDHKNTNGDFALVLYEFKCKTNQLRVKTVIEYDNAGGVLDTTNHDDDTWQDVAPGTAGEVMMRTVCHRQ
jgi:Surface-adhesin protein E